MDKKQKDMAAMIFRDLLLNYNSIREFCRELNEDISDVCRWKKATRKIAPRVVIQLCRLFDVNPYFLRPDIFPPDIKISFSKKNV